MHKFIYAYPFIFGMEERHKRLLVRLNPWWQGEPVSLPAFERDLFATLLKHLRHRQIIAVLGLRRVGKTVLLKQLIQKLDAPKNNVCYISFDDIDFQKYELAEELISYFLEFSDKAKLRYLFLDEVQKLPNWADLLKTYYDTEGNLKIFISGSASLEIKKHKETLAGRLISFHLPVLTFAEFARYFGFGHAISLGSLQREYDLKFGMKRERYSELFADYLFRGAFPELLDVKDGGFIRQYVKESVAEKAVAGISLLTGEDERVIYELFRLLANSSAQLFEMTNLAKTLKVNRNLVSRYIGLLEKGFLIRVSYNFTSSVSKQVRSSKKQYCAHSSFIFALLDYPPAILNTEAAGHLVESAIAGGLDDFSFWREQQHEVDFVLKAGKGLLPVEVKYKAHIDSRDTKGLLKFMDEFKAKEGFVLTKDLFEIQKVDGKKLFFIPAWLFPLLTGL